MRHSDSSPHAPSQVSHLAKQLPVSDEKQAHRHRPHSKGSHVSGSTLAQPGGPQFDLEHTARELARRREEAHIQSRRLGVLFKDLRVVGLGTTASYQPTLGSIFNPFSMIAALQASRHPHLRDILVGFEGVVRPGEMLLVLGRPGSGCTTLLKNLANHRDEYYGVEGDVFYDSLTPKEVEKHYRGDVQYSPKEDIHFPTLTVEQTLSFAAKMRTPEARINQTRHAYIDYVTNLLTTVFGLNHAKNTCVGSASVKGISGGERKRVSIAEALASRSRVNSWDNSTRGLDASTALEFGRALRLASDIDGTTAIVSLYQASETLYQLFDKVCVIYEGRMAYFGPAKDARQYFIDMGYEPAPRQTTSDFLVSVTDPNARAPRFGISVLPRSAAEFADHFQRSKFAALNRTDMDAYAKEFVGNLRVADAYKESVLQEHAMTARARSPYTVSIAMQARAVMIRRAQILMGNKLATILNLVSFLLQGVIVGTAYLHLGASTEAFFSRGGVLFFALLFSAFSAFAEISALFAQRPIIHRHKQAALYHPFVEAIALTLVDIPISFAITIVFAIVLYFLTNLQRTASQFFIFYLFMFTMTLSMKAWFRAVAALCSSEASALSVAGLILMGLIIYTGYTVPKRSMIGALRWITYINPIRYGFESMVANEFHTLNGTCSALVPQGPGYENVTLANQVCFTVGSVSGQNYVDGNEFIRLSYGYMKENTWRNFGIIVAFGIVFAASLMVITEYNTKLSTETSGVLFKRGSRSPSLSPPTADEEKQVHEKDVGSIRSLDVDVTPGALAKQPTTRNVFTWQHIDYSIPTAGGPRKLLDDVSGYVVPGKLTALMGESGAGKTMLLDVLAKRIRVGVVSGEEYVNGHALPENFQAQTGYCQQMDTHVLTDTVREALLFSAKLRQPASVPLSEKRAYVETCLKMCGLEAMADAIVGSLGVEYRKRTTIAVELAAKPELLLFLDEPTSGLDSQSSWAILSFLRQLADHGQAILCTIHQPSAELFQIFDRLLLLQKGGQTVYFGDVGPQSAAVIDYFQHHGSRKCLPFENPAEFILDVIGAGATATVDRDWHAIWQQSPECEKVLNEIDAIHHEGRKGRAIEATFRTKFAAPWLYQARTLFERDIRSHWRNVEYMMAKVMLNAVGGLFIGFTFFKSPTSLQGMQNQLFVRCLCILCLCLTEKDPTLCQAIFLSTMLSVPLANQLQIPYINMRSIYEIRERSSRMYHWTALVTSQILAEVPWNMMGSSLYFFCWYWVVGLPPSRAPYTFLIFSTVFPLYYTTIAMACASMVPNAEIGAEVFVFIFSFVVTFNGVLQPYRLLGWWQWMYHVSPYTYLIEGLVGQALGHRAVTCSPLEIVRVDPPLGQTCGQYFKQYIAMAGGYLQNTNATSACGFCAFATTDEFLGLNSNVFYSHRWRNVGLLCVYILFNLFSVYMLTYLFRIRKRSLS
ncbi:hypothetical protein HGRIS_011492 [Hohenbuehelia grisea]|uniref:ABC transporter domain-containing protein n=1 Tax=Hohenbuehelia grisea TaxID=104357 RepID=A0ABR3JWB5_9AGAR